MATLGLRRCFEFVTREKFEADGEAGLSDPEVLKKWLETPLADVSNTGEDGERITGLDAQKGDSVFFNSYIPRTSNEVHDPERDLEAVKKGGKTIYSDTIGIVKPKVETTALPANDDKEPIEGEGKPRVHFLAEIDSAAPCEHSELLPLPPLLPVWHCSESLYPACYRTILPPSFGFLCFCGICYYVLFDF